MSLQTLIFYKDNLPKSANSFDKMVYSALLDIEEDKITCKNLNDFNFLKQIESGTVIFVLGLIENKPVCAARYLLQDNRKNCYIERQITTREKFRGKGFAGLILETGNMFIKEKLNGKKIRAFIYSNNNASKTLHKKLGYLQKNKGILKNSRYDLIDEESIMFEKKL